MLTLFKKIFIWWNQDTLGTKLKTIFSGNLLVSTHLVINIMRVKKARGGLYITMR